MVTTMAKMTNVQNTEILDKVNSEQVRLAVAEIKSAASSASKAILHLADVLYKWSNKSDWVEIERRLTAERIFDMSIVKRIILIGSNGVLMKKEYWDRLPSGYHHLYPLTQIDDDRLVSLIKQEKIHGGMTVKDSNILKDRFRVKSPPKPRTPKYVNYTIKIKVFSTSGKMNSTINAEFKRIKKNIESVDPSAIIELCS